jgi:hypothetical protein
MKKDVIDHSWLVITPDEGVNFYFDELVLEQVGSLRRKNINLTPNSLDNDTQIRWGSLSFSSFYEGRPIIKTVIYLDGQIHNHISSHCLTQGELLEKITASHFWSLNQLVRQNQGINSSQKRAKVTKKPSNWLGWMAATIVVSVMVITNLDKLIANIWLWLLVPVVLWLLQWGFNRLRL